MHPAPADLSDPRSIRPHAETEPPEFPEAPLLASMRAGDQRAFDDLVRLAGGRMLAVARRMLGSEDDAQEAVQDAFLSAFKALDRFDGRSRLTTWLHRITVNACLMKLRSRRRRPERFIDDLLPEFLPDGHQTVPTRPWKPEGLTGIETSELQALVRLAIGELPADYREVLMLRDIEGLDTEQTAAMLGMTAAGVKTRLHRARQALRTLLEPHFVQRNL
jgi:RNA polymerase sigma-70 factor, ECF subfamily